MNKMGRPKNSELARKRLEPQLYGLWNLKDFAEATRFSVSYWQKNIHRVADENPEFKEFTNLGIKKYERVTFDAVRANQWILDHYIYLKK